jgi:hypothetical protein
MNNKEFTSKKQIRGQYSAWVFDKNVRPLHDYTTWGINDLTKFIEFLKKDRRAVWADIYTAEKPDNIFIRIELRPEEKV